mmetsp:Transcript_58542/g.127157  ORF Transcript_58542/g.127157 Transcript_58542/m.127157 type:complete len:124 (-) Transcript_58542:398-769(-)
MEYLLLMPFDSAANIQAVGSLRDDVSIMNGHQCEQFENLAVKPESVTMARQQPNSRYFSLRHKDVDTDGGSHTSKPLLKEALNRSNPGHHLWAAREHIAHLLPQLLPGCDFTSYSLAVGRRGP